MNGESCAQMQPSIVCRLVSWMALAALALAAILAPAPPANAQASGYTQVSAGDLHTCALRSDGAVDCWGIYSWGGRAEDSDDHYAQVSAGGWHSCALTPDGIAVCWGGLGSPLGPFMQVSAGYEHTCALRRDRSIDCWGHNDYGQATDQTGQYTQVSAGYEHTCALRLDGSVDCWGNNAHGEATDRTGPYTQVSAGGSHTCAVTSGGQIECWGAGTTKTGITPNYGQSIPPSGAFSQVSAGNLHTCGLRTDSTLVCWGYNFYGQVRDTPAGTYKQIDSGTGHACALSTADQLVCWGRNDWKQATVPMPAGPGVTFDLDGFYPPVNPEPALNAVKAGSAVPLKFSLGGDYGLEVIETGSPASRPLDCALLDPGGELTPTRSAAEGGLSYDPLSGQYSYIWKTETVWAGTCRVLSLRLVDGTEHLAAFQFK